LIFLAQKLRWIFDNVDIRLCVHVRVCVYMKAKEVKEAMKKHLDDLQLQANALTESASQIKARGSELITSLVNYFL